MRSTPIQSAAVAAFVLASNALAGAPSYENYELYLRGNFAANPGGAFNVPGGNFISNETVGLDNEANVSVRLSPSTFGGPAVWAGDVASGGVVYSAVGGAVISTTSVNENGRIVWDESFSAPDGVYGVDIDGANGGIVTNRPIGASSWSNVVVNDSGRLGYRAGIEQHAVVNQKTGKPLARELTTVHAEHLNLHVVPFPMTMRAAPNHPPKC